MSAPPSSHPTDAPPSFRLRPARLVDAEAIADLVWQERRRGALKYSLGPKGAHDPEDYSPGMLELRRARIGGRNETFTCLLAESAATSELLGYIELGASGPHLVGRCKWEIFCMYVRHTAAGMGIGRALVSIGVVALLESSVRAGSAAESPCEGKETMVAGTLGVVTMEGNVPAYAFYRRLGATLTAIIGFKVPDMPTSETPVAYFEWPNTGPGSLASLLQEGKRMRPLLA